MLNFYFQSKFSFPTTLCLVLSLDISLEARYVQDKIYPIFNFFSFFHFNNGSYVLCAFLAKKIIHVCSLLSFFASHEFCLPLALVRPFLLPPFFRYLLCSDPHYTSSAQFQQPLNWLCKLCSLFPQNLPVVLHLSDYFSILFVQKPSMAPCCLIGEIQTSQA